MDPDPPDSSLPLTDDVSELTGQSHLGPKDLPVGRDKGVEGEPRRLLHAVRCADLVWKRAPVVDDEHSRLTRPEPAVGRHVVSKADDCADGDARRRGLRCSQELGLPKSVLSSPVWPSEPSPQYSFTGHPPLQHLYAGSSYARGDMSYPHKQHARNRERRIKLNQIIQTYLYIQPPICEVSGLVCRDNIERQIILSLSNTSTFKHSCALLIIPSLSLPPSSCAKSI